MFMCKDTELQRPPDVYMYISWRFQSVISDAPEGEDAVTVFGDPAGASPLLLSSESSSWRVSPTSMRYSVNNEPF